MAKRFSATEIWEEDWFLDMPNEYKLFWYYMLSTCDHAGIFKVNLRSFCSLLGVKISDEKALEYFNEGKARIRVITKSVWFIEDFFVFQYGHILNLNNNVHESAEKAYNKYGINVLEIRGLKEVKERTKRGQKEDTARPKDKDKDILVEKEPEIEIHDGKLVPEMLNLFKQHYPHYPVDATKDFSACLGIAYKIAKEKKWSKESVLNGNMPGVLEVWEKIVLFSTSDKWYSTRSIFDFNTEFQRIVQGMVNSKKNKPQKNYEPTSSSAPLTRL